MRKRWLSVLAAVLILGLGGLALAQTESQQTPQMPMGPGMMGGEGGQMGSMMPMMQGMMQMMNACTQMMGQAPSTERQPSTK